MRKIILTLTIFIFALSNLYAARLYFKKEGFTSELLFTEIAVILEKVEKTDNTLTLRFNKVVGRKLKGQIKDDLFKRMDSGKKFIKITFADNTDFMVRKEGSNVRIVASPKRKNPEIKLGYGIEKPLIKKGSNSKENKEAEDAIGQIDQLTAAGEYDAALTMTEKYLEQPYSQFYQQEGVYRLANIHYKMGSISKDSYVLAAQLFDNFVERYPESYKAREAMIMAAKAKVGGELYYDAVGDYEQIIKIVTDPEVLKDVYRQLTDLYVRLGQFQKAIDNTNSYVEKFKINIPEKQAEIGHYHVLKKENEKAFEIFFTLKDKKLDWRAMAPEVIFSMAKTMEDRKYYDKASESYANLYRIYPSSSISDMAVYRNALVWYKQDKKAKGDELLELAIKNYPQKPGGMLASIEFARRNLNTKVTEDWRKFLALALASPDFNIKASAEVVIIKSLYREQSVEEAQEAINKFTRENFGSQQLKEVYEVEQRIRLDKAQRDFQAGKYEEARSTALKVSDEFPDSVYINEARNIAQDSLYNMIMFKFKQNEFKQVIMDVEDFYAEERHIMKPQQWFDLLDDSYHMQTKGFYEKGDFRRVLANAAHYFNNLKKGKHIPEMRKIYEDALVSIFGKEFNKANYLDVVRLFGTNRGIVNASKSSEFKDDIFGMAAYSLYKVGLYDKARGVLESVTNKSHPMYLVTMLLLDEKIPDFNVNLLDNRALELMTDSLEKTNIDLAVSVLDKYTKDRKKALQLKYRIGLGVFDDLKRENILYGVYTELSENKENRFKGSDEVFLSMGILYYNKNDMQSAIKALKTFIVEHQERDDKRAEGLYYLGKAKARTGDKEGAVKDFLEIVESMKLSVYAEASKKELDELKWYDSLKK